MRYKSINEQNETFIKIIKQNSDLVTILDYIYELKLPNFLYSSRFCFSNDMELL